MRFSFNLSTIHPHLTKIGIILPITGHLKFLEVWPIWCNTAMTPGFSVIQLRDVLQNFMTLVSNKLQQQLNILWKSWLTPDNLHYYLYYCILMQMKNVSTLLLSKQSKNRGMCRPCSGMWQNAFDTGRQTEFCLGLVISTGRCHRLLIFKQQTACGNRIQHVFSKYIQQSHEWIAHKKAHLLRKRFTLQKHWSK